MSVAAPSRVVSRQIGGVPATGNQTLNCGLIKQLRQGMNVLLLWSGAHYAVAANDLVYASNTQNLDLVQTLGTDGLAVLLRSDFQFAPGATPPPGQPLVIEGDLTRLLALDVDHRVLGSLRDGVGVNYSMGHFGGLHLNLYSRRNPKGPGKRWNLNPVGPDEAAPDPRFWSFGGSLDLVRNSDDHRQIVIVPQLLLDFDVLTGSHNQFQAFMQYANWRPAPGQPAQYEMVPQVSFRLRF